MRPSEGFGRIVVVPVQMGAPKLGLLDALLGEWKEYRLCHFPVFFVDIGRKAAEFNLGVAFLAKPLFVLKCSLGAFLCFAEIFPATLATAVVFGKFQPGTRMALCCSFAKPSNSFVRRLGLDVVFEVEA